MKPQLVITEPILDNIKDTIRNLQKVAWKKEVSPEELIKDVNNLQNIIYAFSDENNKVISFTGFSDEEWLELSYDEFREETNRRIYFGCYEYMVTKEDDCDQARLSYLEYLRKKGFRM